MQRPRGGFGYEFWEVDAIAPCLQVESASTVLLAEANCMGRQLEDGL